LDYVTSLCPRFLGESLAAGELCRFGRRAWFLMDPRFRGGVCCHRPYNHTTDAPSPCGGGVSSSAAEPGLVDSLRMWGPCILPGRRAGPGRLAPDVGPMYPPRPQSRAWSIGSGCGAHVSSPAAEPGSTRFTPRSWGECAPSSVELYSSYGPPLSRGSLLSPTV
jgi:hypothetical protein